MQVKSDKDCKAQILKIVVLSGPHKDRRGTVVGSNGKALKNGRQYEVKFDAGDTVFFSGSDLKETSKLY